MMCRVLALVGVALTACNGPASSPDPVDTDSDGDTDALVDTDAPPSPFDRYVTEPASGRRLTAHGLKDARGNERVAWFQDIGLNTRCFPALASDGVVRCLPDYGVPVDTSDAFDSSVVFADAACTQPARVMEPACEAGYFRDPLVTSSPAPGGLGELWRAGDLVTEVYEYDPFFRTCSATTIPDGLVARLVEDAPLSGFVAFEASGVDVTGTLGRRVLTGEDGSRLVDGLWDVQGDQPLGLVEDGDGWRAVPDPVRGLDADLYRASCFGSDLAIVAPLRAEMPLWAVIEDEAGDEQVFAVTSEQRNRCGRLFEVVTVDDDEAVYVLASSATPLDGFTRVLGSVDTGSGVRFVHLVDEEGTPLAPAEGWTLDDAAPESILAAGTAGTERLAVGPPVHLSSVLGVDCALALYRDSSRLSGSALAAVGDYVVGVVDTQCTTEPWAVPLALSAGRIASKSAFGIRWHTLVDGTCYDRGVVRKGIRVDAIDAVPLTGVGETL